MRPFAGAIGEDFILVQENACAHNARVSMKCLHEQRIAVMEWPARTSDLHPVKHMSDMLDRGVRARQVPPDSVLTLAEITDWRNIPQDSIRRVIRRMSNRCRECIQARRGHTHY